MAGRGDLPASGFGSQLRRRRDEKGWTQQELAEATGIHANTIARLERGEHEPAWPLVLALAKALGVDCTAFNAEPGTEPEKSVEKPTAKKPAAKKGGKK
ncbi:MAG TPA: helix-turn-helix transcriptional regulator [Gemmata sp.]|jgi:transcriptional regulator with XRE-family HTH domain|nr:helix-turn-helix transcriptional regulator [Gemmata sp.]